MKTLLEIRKFAVEQAVAVMGAGCPEKDVVAKAKEIETYLVGKAEIPEFIDENEQLTSIIGVIAGLVLNAIHPATCCEVAGLKKTEEPPKE